MDEDPADQRDTVIDRLSREIPGLVSRPDHRWEQYLLDWSRVAEDETGTLRRRLAGIRRALRSELGLTDRQEAAPWDRRIVLEHFWLLYEKTWYDPQAESFLAQKFVDVARADFGAIDAVCLWHSYPRLGLDHRNQFDYYRDLPGGIAGLTTLVQALHRSGVRGFLAYNPWDTGTRREEKPDGETLVDLLSATDADGIFLDTLSSAEPSLREAVLSARPDAALCPELLPRLAELPLLAGGWQQFALSEPPLVLAHRWLDPGFCLRHVDRYARTRRDQIAIAFLHGTGHVVWENVFGWWNPWGEHDRRLIGQTSALLQAYSDFFRDPDWEPYVPTGIPGVQAMEWHLKGSVLYTLYNPNNRPCDDITLTLPAGLSGAVFDLWRSQELSRSRDGRTVSCSLQPRSPGCVLAGADPRPLPWTEAVGDSRRHAPVTLADYRPRPGRAVSGPAQDPGRDTVRVPGGRYVMRVRRACNEVMEGGSYGDISHPTAKAVPDKQFQLEAYLIDRTPVTKAEYARFLRESRYRPRTLARFLDDWTRPEGGESKPHLWAPPSGREDHPVVWVSLDDARAYAGWAGMRLPTEAEWQLAAEGPERRLWPWGDASDPGRCNGDSPATTSVRGYPDGASAFGCLDMSGNVWEWTESERDDGHMRYAMVRGGCHLRVEGSIWYTASGAQPCGVHEKVPLLDAGLDRLATVGFRCVR